MISTLPDLRTWARLLADGTLLSPETQSARLQTQLLLPGQPVRYGLAIADVAGFLGHNGGIAGYNTMMLHDPSIDATIVTVANLSGPAKGAADTIAMQVLQSFYPERFTPTPS
jgi:D-alanyl-D-alanine carboxypeptidase